MKRLVFAMLIFVITAAVLVQPHSTQAAVPFEDFEGYAGDGSVLAESLTVSGVTFDSGNNFAVFTSGGFDLMSVNLLGQIVPGSDTLTMNFNQSQNTATFDWAVRSDTTLIVDGYLGGSPAFTQSFLGFASSFAGFYEETAVVTGTFDSLVLSNASGDLIAIDNLSSTDAPIVAPVTAMNVPHVTDIRINAWQQVVAYDSPAGSPAKLLSGAVIVLPHDSNGDGYDTYVVTDTAVVDGVTWYSIFLGNESFVWVNGSEVTLQ